MLEWTRVDAMKLRASTAPGGAGGGQRMGVTGFGDGTSGLPPSFNASLSVGQTQCYLMYARNLAKQKRFHKWKIGLQFAHEKL